MHEFELIKKYFSKLSNKNKSSLNLNDDVFYDKSKKLVVSIDTYVEGIRIWMHIWKKQQCLIYFTTDIALLTHD